MSVTAREIMTPDPVCARSSDSVLDAAMRMVELGVGSLPICGEDNIVKGVITDRDIVVKVIAEANDPRAVHVGELAQDQIVTISADDSAEDILATMRRHQVRRLPVIEGDELIGIVALADVARSVDDPPVGALVEALSVEG
jgi:CBS domain-containing protein